jgi:hypothetical protein
VTGLPAAVGPLTVTGLPAAVGPLTVIVRRRAAVPPTGTVRRRAAVPPTGTVRRRETARPTVTVPPPAAGSVAETVRRAPRTEVATAAGALTAVRAVTTGAGAPLLAGALRVPMGASAVVTVRPRADHVATSAAVTAVSTVGPLTTVRAAAPSAVTVVQPVTVTPAAPSVATVRVGQAGIATPTGGTAGSAAARVATGLGQASAARVAQVSVLVPRTGRPVAMASAGTCPTGSVGRSPVTGLLPAQAAGGRLTGARLAREAVRAPVRGRLASATGRGRKAPVTGTTGGAVSPPSRGYPTALPMTSSLATCARSSVVSRSTGRPP